MTTERTWPPSAAALTASRPASAPVGTTIRPPLFEERLELLAILQHPRHRERDERATGGQRRSATPEISTAAGLRPQRRRAREREARHVRRELRPRRRRRRADRREGHALDAARGEELRHGQADGAEACDGDSHCLAARRRAARRCRGGGGAGTPKLSMDNWGPARGLRRARLASRCALRAALARMRGALHAALRAARRGAPRRRRRSLDDDTAERVPIDRAAGPRQAVPRRPRRGGRSAAEGRRADAGRHPSTEFAPRASACTRAAVQDSR